MKAFFSKLQQNSYEILRVVSFLVAIIVVAWVSPRERMFKYEFRVGKPWNHKDLYAPFDFSIYKTSAELSKEKSDALKNVHPYFQFDPNATDAGRVQLIQTFNQSWKNIINDTTRQVNRHDSLTYLHTLLSVYDEVEKGIIRMNPVIENKEGSFQINLIKDNTLRVVNLSQLYTVQEADGLAIRTLRQLHSRDSSMLYQVINNSLVQNVIFDQKKTDLVTQEMMSKVSPVMGLVQKGELIISQGELVTARKFQVLQSLKKEYEQELGTTEAWKYVFSASVALIVLLFFIEYLFLRVFVRSIFDELRNLHLLLGTQVVLLVVSFLVFSYYPGWSYLIPYSLLPIIVATFLERRASLVVYLITLMILGFYAPNSFEFFYTQFTTGFVAIMSVGQLSKRWHLVKTSLLVFLTYMLVYFSMLLIQDASFINTSSRFIMMLAGSSFLILLAFPIIFVYEKMFGLVTQLTLLELSNTNNTLLRDLAEKAPGTFQHSMQVANLASEVLFVIGGDALLARTGALYHDIGKMDHPLYFVENQPPGYNPHDELEYEESARIIIGHVLRGIEMARKARLPEQIIDFIRTHHGTRRVEYFYRLEQKQNPGMEVDEAEFRYHGPVPFSRETAVVMMSDSVEAASRSMVNPTEQKINDLVELIINSMMETHQFSNAPITLREITISKKVLKKKLLHIHHIRIAYPD
ncbi:MAG: HDIG domain-containing protein [Bacteroidales bacterium]|nr:HDIG domain-containing protein [Bacteroidales bacterium]